MKCKLSVFNFFCCLIVVVGLMVTSDVHAIRKGDRVVLQNTYPYGRRNVRLNPRIDPNERPRTVSEGTRGKVLKDPVNGPNYTWYKVKWDTPDELEGWTADSKSGCAYIGSAEMADKRDVITAKLFKINVNDIDRLTNHDYNGYRCHPHDDRRNCDGYYGGHAGLDVQTTSEYDKNRNDPFYSLTSGTVIRANRGDADTHSVIAVYNDSHGKSYGNKGMTIFYVHARAVDVVIDETVEIGDRLGWQGNTGLEHENDKIAAHVHVEVRVGKRISSSCGIKQAQDTDSPNIPPVNYLFRAINDVNQDGTLNILDLLLVFNHRGEDVEEYPQYDVNGDETIDWNDLWDVWGNFSETAAPQLNVDNNELFTNAPIENALFANYPNPFNPETWIPYSLKNASDTRIIIYNVRGNIVRQLNLGHQPAGYYTSRSRAAYWDGKNVLGEPVASGIYFYTITTNDYTATRKMLIMK